MNDTPQQDPSKLFVGNLPWSVSEDELTSMFSEYGELEDVHLVTDRNTGRSRGIAFVKFTDEATAKAAMEAVNETEQDGRTIRVSIAQPRKPREDRGGDRGGYNNSRGGDRGGYNRGGNSRY
jgi:RNA recognition motif-containing protein